MSPPAATSRLLLIADRRQGATLPGGAPVRRYRIARVLFDAPAAERAEWTAAGEREATD